MPKPLARLAHLLSEGASWLGWRRERPAPAPPRSRPNVAPVRLIVQPEDGLAPVLRGIGGAKRTLDVSIFRLDDKRVAKAVKAAVARGVAVRALVAHRNSAGERELRALEVWLLEAGATVCRTRDDLVRYHQKMMIVDRQTLYVFGFNFTHQDIERSRSFGLVFRDRAIVREALRLFEADCARRAFTPRSHSLVVSPHNARAKLRALILAAKHRLLIYGVEIDDAAMIKLLAARARAGVDVRIVGRIRGKRMGLRTAQYAAGRLHVRAIVQDARCVFIGSQGLRKVELDRRREVGVIVKDAAVIRAVAARFEKDWSHALGGKD
jgi:phosphatidylserine/phosphatidylglycerophosphate/cardiolipin synthase-like enzyme